MRGYAFDASKIVRRRCPGGHAVGQAFHVGDVRFGSMTKVSDVHFGMGHRQPLQLDASKLRRDLFKMLKAVEHDGRTIEIRRNGRVVAVLRPPPARAKSEKPKFDRRRLVRICRRHHIERLALFGSILRDDFGPESDVDVLVDPEPGHLTTLKEYNETLEDLIDLFGRRVDLLKRSVVERSLNETRKRSILDSAQVIYEAR